MTVFFLTCTEPLDSWRHENGRHWDTCYEPREIDYEAAADYNTRIDVQYPEEVVEMVNRALGIEDPGPSTDGP